MNRSIAILGEYTPSFPPHQATDAAMAHACRKLSVEVAATWLSTEEIDPLLFQKYSGILVAPGSPYKTRLIADYGSGCRGGCAGYRISNHPFWIGTLFVPQARSTFDAPHPLITAFLQACLQR